MNTSDKIDQLAISLAAAQGAFGGIKKTGKNPHLKNEYVTLDDIINGVRKPLANNHLAYTQMLDSYNGSMVLTTTLMHESGQWLSSQVEVAAGEGNRGVNALQALGSSITYMKRYTLSAMLGIAADTDDDGVGAGNGSGPRKQQPQQSPQQPFKVQPPAGNRPLSAELVRDVCRTKAKWQDGHRIDGEPITEGQVKSIPSLLEKATPNLSGPDKGKARHAVLAYLFGTPVNSTNLLTKDEASAVISWLKEDESWDVNQYAEAEVANVLTASAVEAGQKEMELETA